MSDTLDDDRMCQCTDRAGQLAALLPDFREDIQAEEAKSGPLSFMASALKVVVLGMYLRAFDIPRNPPDVDDPIMVNGLQGMMIMVVGALLKNPLWRHMYFGLLHAIARDSRKIIVELQSEDEGEPEEGKLSVYVVIEDNTNTGQGIKACAIHEVQWAREWANGLRIQKHGPSASQYAIRDDDASDLNVADYANKPGNRVQPVFDQQVHLQGFKMQDAANDSDQDDGCQLMPLEKVGVLNLRRATMYMWEHLQDNISRKAMTAMVGRGLNVRFCNPWTTYSQWLGNCQLWDQLFESTQVMQRIIPVVRQQSVFECVKNIEASVCKLPFPTPKKNGKNNHGILTSIPELQIPKPKLKKRKRLADSDSIGSDYITDEDGDTRRMKNYSLRWLVRRLVATWCSAEEQQMLRFVVPDQRCVLNCEQATEREIRDLQAYQDVLSDIAGLTRETVKFTSLSWQACAWIGQGRIEEVLQKSTEDFVMSMKQLKYATSHFKNQTSVCGLPGFGLHIKDLYALSQMPPAKFNLKLSRMTSTSKKFASITAQENAKENIPA